MQNLVWFLIMQIILWPLHPLRLYKFTVHFSRQMLWKRFIEKVKENKLFITSHIFNLHVSYFPIALVILFTHSWKLNELRIFNWRVLPETHSSGTQGFQCHGFSGILGSTGLIKMKAASPTPPISYFLSILSVIQM